MNISRKTRITVAAAAAVLAPLGLALPAQAVPVTHDGCTITTDAPIFTNHFTSGGVKLFDYVYHLECQPSAAGVTVQVRQDRYESDLVGRFGDPDAPDEFTGSSTQTLSFAAAGQTRNVTVRATLPTVNDDTDVPLEMYQSSKFRVTSGAVTGTWSIPSLSAARALTG